MSTAVGEWAPLAAMPSMGDDEFERWVTLLERRTGVVVPAVRKSFLVTSLRGRMRETGHASFAQYYEDLVNGVRGAIEWATLVDRLTVHETHFFRHPPSLEFIRDEWLPTQVHSPDWSGNVHAWSLGCSTGEEAYTLAMILDGGLAKLTAKYYFGVTGTDVSQSALSVGKSGMYPRQKVGEVPEPYRAKYCVDVDQDSFLIREVLRKRVGFAQFNLLDAARAPIRQLDLIFCQNVLIYFSRELRRELLAKLAGLLSPGGLLVLGAGEVLSWSHPKLERAGGRQVLAYRRKA